MNALGFRPSLSKEDAQTRLQRRRWHWRWKKAPPNKAPKCVWLPCQQVTVGDPCDAVLLVNGYARTVAPLNTDSLETEPISTNFPYPLSDKETLQLCQDALLQWRLGRLIQRSSNRTLHLGTLVYHPYWVALREVGRNGKRLRFRMLDALTGKTAAQAVSLGFLEALKASNQ